MKDHKIDKYKTLNNQSVGTIRLYRLYSLLSIVLLMFKCFVLFLDIIV